MDKHLYNGILFNDKEELFKNYLKELLSGATTWITLKYILLRDSTHKSYIFYDYIHMTLWKR